MSIMNQSNDDPDLYALAKASCGRYFFLEAKGPSPRSTSGGQHEEVLIVSAILIALNAAMPTLAADPSSLPILSRRRPVNH
jgi:hypothetical protein